MSALALVRQADIARVMREAKKHGAKKVHIGPDGSIDIILVEEHLGEADKISAQPTPAQEPESYIGPLAPNTQKVDF